MRYAMPSSRGPDWWPELSVGISRPPPDHPHTRPVPRRGVRALRNGNSHVPAETAERLVTTTLAAAGYDGGLVGKLHLAAAAKAPERRVDDGYRYFQYSHAPRNDWKLGEHQ